MSTAANASAPGSEMNRPMVAKCVRLLSSPVDGEVVAAARSLLRILATTGHDIHDIAREIEVAPAPPKSSNGNLTRLIAVLLECVDAMTDWEEQFVFSVDRQHRYGRPLSDKQKERLIAIARKMGL